ncbi:MAG: 4-hydroxy-3-methylbut-2-enyl diphosphate reductase [Vulcanimicrobiaceae bacterium]
MMPPRTQMRRIILCQPRGFCAGVERAVRAIDDILERTDETIYVRKEVVHNRRVVESFKARGVVFVDDVEDAAAGGLLVFSAHGVAPDVYARAEQRRLRTIDATCPLVTKVHREVRRFVAQGCTVLLVGHEGHEEVEGTLGYGPGRMMLVQNVDEAKAVEVRDPDRVAVVTQTTLALSESREIIGVLKGRFPNIAEPSRPDVCYATENRQQALRALAKQTEVIIVVGSTNSSNSRSLVDVAKAEGVPAYLVDDAKAIDGQWLEGVTTLGVTAGASSPESLVMEVIDRVRELQPEFVQVETLGEAEPSMTFRAPDLSATER